MSTLSSRETIRTITCARQRLDKGEACECGCMGQGAGKGWLITVRCGSDEISWIQPPMHDPREGVGYVRDFDCDTLKGDFSSLLEQFDNLRSDELASENCYDWIGSFFKDSAGRPMDESHRNDADWVYQYCHQVAVPPGKLQAGDVIIFQGSGTVRTGPGEHVRHVAIATGYGDEISQMWYTREIQEAIVKRKTFASSEEERDRSKVRHGFYTVTRDSLANLIDKFTHEDKKFVFTPYEVWRVSDPRFGDFDHLKGCE